MQRLSRNILQPSPIYFRYSKIRLLSSGGTPPYLLLKSTNGSHIFFQLSNFQFSLLNFHFKDVPEKAAKPTSKNNATAQPNLFRMHKN